MNLNSKKKIIKQNFIVLEVIWLVCAYCDVTTLGLQASKHAISRVNFYLQLPTTLMLYIYED